jgi:arsenate reductase (thioredoxin)
MPGSVRYSDRVHNVLFLSLKNTARTLMAECLLNKGSTGLLKAYSAGTDPAGVVDPLTLTTLRNHGCPVEGLAPKNVNIFNDNDATEIDMIFTFCDRSHGQAIALWPGHSYTALWSIPDPMIEMSSIGLKEAAFTAAYYAVKDRIGALLAL